MNTLNLILGTAGTSSVAAGVAFVVVAIAGIVWYLKSRKKKANYTGGGGDVENPLDTHDPADPTKN
jgi:uncharacterized membrane protein YuzA (DUF378 family)